MHVINNTITHGTQSFSLLTERNTAPETEINVGAELLQLRPHSGEGRDGAGAGGEGGAGSGGGGSGGRGGGGWSRGVTTCASLTYPVSLNISRKYPVSRPTMQA